MQPIGKNTVSTVEDYTYFSSNCKIYTKIECAPKGHNASLKIFQTIKTIHSMFLEHNKIYK